MPKRNQLATRLKHTLDSVIIGGGAIFAVALQIPWLQPAFSKIGLGSSEALLGSLIPIALALTYFEVISIRRENKTIEQPTFSSAMEMYPTLRERIKLCTGRDRTLRVLGMTLYTAWPSLRFWVYQDELNGWGIELCAYANDRQVTGVPENWSNDSNHQIADIRYVAAQGDIHRRHIQLQGFTYNFTPAVHGFALGNGDLFISTLLWDKSSGELTLNRFQYLFYAASEQTEAAQAARRLFESWWLRAKKDRGKSQEPRTDENFPA